MASGATSLIDQEAMNKYFLPHLEGQKLVTTEISQVPLSGVLSLLNGAKKLGIPSVLDVDVQPSVAVEQAQLGSMEELIKVVRSVDVLKPAKHAALELLTLLDSNLRCFCCPLRYSCSPL